MSTFKYLFRLLLAIGSPSFSKPMAVAGTYFAVLIRWRQFTPSSAAGDCRQTAAGTCFF